MNSINLCFECDFELREGINRLTNCLGFCESADGILVEAVKGKNLNCTQCSSCTVV